MNHTLYIEVNRLKRETRFDCKFNKDYPSYQFHTDEVKIIIEGSIYNKDEKSIQEAIDKWVNIKTRKAECFYRITEDWDGDFNWYIEDKTNHYLAFGNDFFGRLPLYYSIADDMFVISRSLKMCVERLRPTSNKNSLASYLLLGYAIDNKTIYDSLLKFPPNSFISFDLNNSEFSMHNGSFIDLDSKIEQVDSNYLIQTLSTSLLNRIGKHPNTSLALSGGLDSRLIASLAKYNGLEIPCNTFNYANWYDRDISSAKEISHRLGMNDHTFVEIPDSNLNNQVEELFSAKSGQNFLGMAYLLPFLNMYRNHNIAMMTGDGGDKTLESLLPFKKLRNSKQFWSYLITNNAISEIKNVSKIVGILEEDIKNYILKRIEDYPEKSWNDKYIRFILQERGLNWAIEGEDRNRHFCWSISPFYTKEFYRYALSISNKEKRNGKLFNQLFKILPGNLNEVNNPNWNTALNDANELKKLQIKQIVKQRLPFLKHKKELKLSFDTWISNYKLHPIEPIENTTINLLFLRQLSVNESTFWYYYTACRMLNNC